MYCSSVIPKSLKGFECLITVVANTAHVSHSRARYHEFFCDAQEFNLMCCSSVKHKSLVGVESLITAIANISFHTTWPDLPHEPGIMNSSVTPKSLITCAVLL